MTVKEVTNISDKNVEYEVLGDGEPVIVLLNGLHMPMSSWDRLTPYLRKTGTILLYNRLGVGASDRPTEPQDGGTIATQLNSLLSVLSLRKPVILVGHSMGGLYANLYCRLYPENVGGVVLLDATHPDEPAFHEANPGFVGKLLKIVPSLKSYSPQKDTNSEFNSVSTAVKETDGAPSFPSVPLLVISGGKNMLFVPQFAFDHHQKKQKELATLAPQTTHLIAERSSHFPQFSEPEFVADAIVNFIEALN